MECSINCLSCSSLLPHSGRRFRASQHPQTSGILLFLRTLRMNSEIVSIPGILPCILRAVMVISQIASHMGPKIASRYGSDLAISVATGPTSLLGCYSVALHIWMIHTINIDLLSDSNELLAVRIGRPKALYGRHETLRSQWTTQASLCFGVQPTHPQMDDSYSCIQRKG